MLKIFDEIKAAIDSDPETYGKYLAQYTHRTGLDVFDYLNGQRVIHDNGYVEDQLGIDAGKFITIIGKSGTGKSTGALQMAHGIISRYDNGNVFILDFERGNTKARIRNITGMSDETYDHTVNLQNVGISTETVLAMAMKIRDMKLEHQKELICDHADGILDPEDMKVRKIMPPTILFIDSIALMVPKAVMDKNEMGGQMDATALAKVNTQMVKRLTSVLGEANIIPIFINHINQKISTGPMPTAASLNYLSPDETLPGGNAPQYLANTLIKYIAGTKLKPEEGFGIKGFEVKMQIIKSRTAPAGNVATFIYDQNEGFDNLLTNFMLLKQNKRITGAGRSFCLDTCPEIKFSMKSFKDTYNSNPKLKAEFDAVLKEELEKWLVVSTKIKRENKENELRMEAEMLAELK